MTYLKMAMTALSGAGLLTKLIIALGLAGSLLTAYGVWHHKVYQKGVNAAIAGIAREDEGWINRAFQARGKLKECKDAGRGWDQTTGRCL
jgi:hypothetical protein